MRRPGPDRRRRRPPAPIGVVLAGGNGRRIGGSKATVELCGKPLVWYPLAALQMALADVAVIAKADTELPSLPGVTVWIEPPSPRHPLAGLRQALVLADDRPVLACAVDMPFVSPGLIRTLAQPDPRGAPAVVAAHEGAIQPLLGCYQPGVAGLLPRPDSDVSLRAAVGAIGPRLLEVPDAEELFNINAPEDLLQAAAILDRRRQHYPKVKS